ncbi:HEAT repeat-containing protein [Bacillus sp. OV166]|uniref:HEAT repeat domain-containing protein n=1 Tax=Bacillus sp. OV166 TaxID=1882763 RepID=UPI000A2AEB3E|nr:HEAT repeat domain-containing protein [Bacillus sp. OV166]SMQ81000.1 HEAT repeat-containing protein [Bacillus sp. OV166]
MDEKELLELIKQMSETDTIYKEGYYTSEDSPSWNAYRKAEQLTDANLIPFLNNLLEKSKDRETRKDIYFILGKIGKNTGDKRISTSLIKWLETETNKYLLEEILNRIAEQRNIQECSPIIKFIKDERPSVRHSAMHAMQACEKSMAEEALIRILSDSSDEYDLTYAISVLSKIGSNKAIPHLINSLGHPKVDVKCSALSALNELGNSSLLPVFLEALKERSSAVKGYALLGINKHGDETAINPVIERIKTILKRKRTVESDELILGLELLIRFETKYQEILELFDWIKFKKWDFLFDTEKIWVDKNISKGFLN